MLDDILENVGDSLTGQARCVAAVLKERRELSEEMNTRFDTMKRTVQAIFTVEGAKGIPVKLRAEAADALGVEGHPRLWLPHQEEYWVRVEGGTYTMGAQKDDPGEANYDVEAYEDEEIRRVTVTPFRIGRYPVTVHEYGIFLANSEGQEVPSDWDEQVLAPTRPVVNANWHDAMAYCDWLGLNLPSEEQWEYAARGKAARRYAWGNETPDEFRANCDGKVGRLSAVGLFVAGNSPEGVSDLTGNVLEWTTSNYLEGGKVVRGGAYFSHGWYLRSAYRNDVVAGYRHGDIGFRCIRED